ncbi:glycosyltransferase [Amycolatopsis sp. NBC_01488]|uniref:glycosyltransferase n=1 Tax=Amycolatopsis sp. NBC_01488 TaxID=2903563 RepID=UPI002E29ADD4|nr:glycosyltransferase [Amycolatopsis sp. NBC_01488]
MRVLIAVTGSPGEVLPHTGLGARLVADGHEVTVATHERFADVVAQAGLGFRPVPGDPRETGRSAEGRHWLRAGSGPLGMVHVIRLFTEKLRRINEGVLDAAREGADLMLVSPEAACAYAIAESLGIASAGVYLQPLAPTGEFIHQSMSGLGSLGRWGNRMSAVAVNRAWGLSFAGVTRDLSRLLGEPVPRVDAMFRRQDRQRWPVLHPTSPQLLRRPADWRPGLEVTGYLWPWRDPGWTPPAELTDFLAAGSPPVYVGFGSMELDEPEKVSALVMAALRQAGLRGIVSAGWSGLTASGDDVLTVGDVPHDWLFPRMAAVVCHGGHGTTGAVLRAGVPAVPVPIFADQPFWSGLLTRQGVSPGPVPFRKLTAERLAGALRAAVTDPGYRRRAEVLAAAVGAEDGAGAALDVVKRVAG